MISCYILTDLPVKEILNTYINRYPVTTLIGYSTPKVVDWNLIFRENPNILFVDISLVASNRTTLMRLGRVSSLIYVSATKLNAFEAFETMGFDYLLMPLIFERFEMSLNKFIHLSLSAPPLNVKKPIPITDSFFIKSDAKGQREVMVKCSDVVFIEALQNYVVLHMVGDKKFTCHNTMKEMEESLPENFFIRVHKSFIINLEKVSAIEGNNIIMNERYRVLIGSTFRRGFLEMKNLKMIKKKSYVIALDYSRTASVFVCYVGLFFGYLDSGLI